MTQVAGHLDFYSCLGAKGGAIYINEGHMILQGGSQDRVEKQSHLCFCFIRWWGGEPCFLQGRTNKQNTSFDRIAGGR